MTTATTQSRRDLVLAALPGDCHHVAAETGLGKTTIWRWLNDLHDKKETHVTSWARSPGGGPFVPTYAPGAGEDKPCTIKPMSQAQKSRRHMLKAKKEGTWETRKARERAKHWANRAKTHPDPLVALFFGMGRPAHQ